MRRVRQPPAPSVPETVPPVSQFSASVPVTAASAQPPPDSALTSGQHASAGSGAAVDAAQAQRWAHAFVRSRRENFITISALVPRHLRQDYANVYAFCRLADDIADERIAGESETLAAQRASQRLLGLAQAIETLPERAPTLPQAATPAQRDEYLMMLALRDTVLRHRLSTQPLLALLDAFQQDQTLRHYTTWEQLESYAARSANPVGRIVMALHGLGDGSLSVSDDAPLASQQRAADAICTGLQFANFWQDIRRDLLERDRVYLPGNDTGIAPTQLRDWLSRHADPTVRRRFASELAMACRRTWTLFDQGRAFAACPDRTLAWNVWLFRKAGEAVLIEIERYEYTTLWQRVRVSTVDRLMLAARAIVGARTNCRPPLS